MKGWRGRRGPRTVAAALALGAYALLPLAASDYALSVLTLAGIAAVGAYGLNVVTGFAGQLSLGHAAFLGAGAYAGAAVGGPLAVWLVAAAAVGGLLGLAVSPFAVRLRGHTLAVATLALVFVGQHVFRRWTSVTGGHAGRSDLPAPDLPGSHDQGWFWLVWALVAVVAALVAALARSRPGRAMAAVRTSEEAAAVMGVDVARTKVAAFVVSGALAGAAGALYGSYKHYVGPEDWGLLVSIQYLAMVLIGGIGTLAGPVLGALFVTGLPFLVEEVVGASPGGLTGAVTAAQASRMLFGVLVVAFVLAEPRGLTQLLGRARDVTRRHRARVESECP